MPRNRVCQGTVSLDDVRGSQWQRGEYLRRRPLRVRRIFRINPSGQRAVATVVRGDEDVS